MSAPVTKVTMDTDLTDAVKLMNDMNIRRLVITDSKGIPINIVTIGFGVAEFPEDGKSSDELLNISDEHLYKEKGAGKNRVVHD